MMIMNSQVWLLLLLLISNSKKIRMMAMRSFLKEAGMNEDYDATFANLKGRRKRLFELRMKMNEARKGNQTAMVAEKKKLEGPGESRGISKQKWLEERKKKIGRLLDANGLDMSKDYMLDTQEMAESKYKKWEKDPAPAGWDVFNQKTLYNAYKRRSKDILVDHEEYNRLKEADPEFYREASSLQYGIAPKVSEEKIDKMIKELKGREDKSRSFITLVPFYFTCTFTASMFDVCRKDKRCKIGFKF